MKRDCLLLGAMTLLFAGTSLTASAPAYYGVGAQIVSAHFGRLEQADDASQYAAISRDGRFVVFQTRARNLYADDDPDPPGQFRIGGIFRFELDTRQLELVADGEIRDEGTDELLVRGAQNPSVSADGRYVAFSTAQALVPADTNGNVDVYVRDMTLPIRSPGAFDLVSATDGGDTPASYGASNPDLPGLNPGSEVTRGVGISQDGSTVAFRTFNVTSNLPSGGPTDTPPFQVFVRDRDANSTTLVTRTSSTGQPAGGAEGPAGISGDGTTVVWTGRNAPAQTRFIDGENTDVSVFHYLWRRMADGPAAPTRRITGEADPDDPACPPDAQVNFDQSSVGPCYGALTEQEASRGNISGQLPSLSSDGYTAAFLTGSGPRPDVTTGPGTDLYVTRMSPGLTRKAATVELTREGLQTDQATSTPIDSIAMSADARWVALTTTRTTFVHPRLRLIGTPRAAPTARELYVASLADGTIERVARSYSGGDIDADVFNDPSISADGGRLAFVSQAGNLFVGDGNNRSDVFAVTRQPEPQQQPPPPGLGSGGGSGIEQLIEEPGDADLFLPVSSRSLRGGVVVLRVRLPASGTVSANARFRVRPGQRQRVLARATRFSPRAARVRLTLRPVRRYRALLRRRGAVRARVAVRFSPSRGGVRLSRSLRVVFRIKAPRRSRNR